MKNFDHYTERNNFCEALRKMDVHFRDSVAMTTESAYVYIPFCDDRTNLCARFSDHPRARDRVRESVHITTHMQMGAFLAKVRKAARGGAFYSYSAERRIEKEMRIERQFEEGKQRHANYLERLQNKTRCNPSNIVAHRIGDLLRNSVKTPIYEKNSRYQTHLDRRLVRDFRAQVKAAGVWDAAVDGAWREALRAGRKLAANYRRRTLIEWKRLRPDLDGDIDAIEKRKYTFYRNRFITACRAVHTAIEAQF